MTVIYSKSNNEIEKEQENAYDLRLEKKEIYETTEEIKKELWEKWKKKYKNAQIFPDAVKNINQETIGYLLLFKNVIFYNNLVLKYKLTPQQRNILPQIVWQVVINGNIDSIDVLLKEKTEIDENRCGEIADLIKKEILDNIKNSKGIFKINKKENTPVEMKLEDALKRFPEIGEQAVSGVSLKGKGFSDMLRPTIKNWIKDYYQEMGTGKHDLMQRGDYLYHSKNTKGISEAERQKLMTIIKSLEDGELLKIDEQQKEIIFDAYKEPQKVDIKSSIKDNFHKKSFFSFLQKKENTPVEQEKEEDQKNSRSGMEKINKKIQDEAIVSSGYILQKKENKPQDAVKKQVEIKKVEIEQVEAPKKKIVFNQMETTSNTNRTQIKQKEEEKDSPYIIKPLSMESNKKGRNDFDISPNVIDLRK